MNLIQYLPDFYGESPQVVALQGALDSQIQALWAARDGLLDQLNISTATYGLKWWEEALGIPVDESRSAVFRRSRILSKIRGQGTTTVAMIRSMAKSFSDGEVDVIEHPAEYTVDIKFTGTIGIPPNMDDLSAALAEILPAHIAYDYIIICRTWDQLEVLIWNELDAYTWDELLEGDI